MISNIPDSAQPLVLSYIGIRRAIGLSGLLLPLALGPGGWLFGIPVQDNMSSYYHTGMRDIFVGTLCAMGVFLYCYRGHDWIEDWTANIGCASALGVALFPLDPHSDPLIQKSITGYLHSASGAVFFLTLSFYSLFHFPTARSRNDEDEPHVAQRNLVYRSSGIIILTSMLAMGTYLFLIPQPWKLWLNRYNFLFWMEWVAVWAFAAAWLTKGRVIVADLAIDVLAWTQEIASQNLPGKVDRR